MSVINLQTERDYWEALKMEAIDPQARRICQRELEHALAKIDWQENIEIRPRG